MELAPAFRGYGRKGSLIENPQSLERDKEIEAIKEKLKDADRFELQDALMPYELPLNFKEKNQRAGVGYE